MRPDYIILFIVFEHLRHIQPFLSVLQHKNQRRSRLKLILTCYVDPLHSDVYDLPQTAARTVDISRLDDQSTNAIIFYIYLAEHPLKEDQRLSKADSWEIQDKRSKQNNT